MKEEKLKLAEEIRKMKEQLQQLKEGKPIEDDETTDEITGEPTVEQVDEAAYGWYNPAGWWGSSGDQPEQNAAE